MIKEPAQNLKTSLSERLNILSIMKGIVLSYIITIPLFLIFSFVLTYSDFPEKYVSPLVVVITILSILFAGAYSTKRRQSRGWLNGGFVGLVYIFVLYLFSSIISNNYGMDKKVLSMFLIGILSGSIGGIIGINLKHKVKKKFKTKK